MKFHHHHHHQSRDDNKNKKSVPDDGIGGDQLDPSSASSSHHGRVTISSSTHSTSSSSTLVLTPPSRRRGENWNKPPKKRRLKQQDDDDQRLQQQHGNRLFGSSQSTSSQFLLLQENNLTVAGVGVGVGVPVSSTSSFNNNNNNNTSLQNMVRQAMMNIEAAAAATPQVLGGESEEEIILQQQQKSSSSLLSQSLSPSTDLVLKRPSQSKLFSQPSNYVSTSQHPSPQHMEEEAEADNEDFSSCFVPEVSRRLEHRQAIWWKVDTKEQQQLFNQQMVQLGGWIEQIQSDNNAYLASHPYLQKQKESSNGQRHRRRGRQQQQQLGQSSSSSSFSWSSSTSFCTMLLEGSTAQQMSTEAESFSLSPIPLHGHHHQQQQQQQQKKSLIMHPEVDGHDRQKTSSATARNILTNLSCNSPSRSSLLGDDDNEGIVINNNNNSSGGGREDKEDMDTTTTSLLEPFQVQKAIGASAGVPEENRRDSSNSSSSSTFDNLSVPASILNNGLTVPFLSTNPFTMSSDSTVDDKNHNSELYHHRQRRPSPKYRDENHPPLYPTILEFDQAADEDMKHDFESSRGGRGGRGDVTTSIARQEYIDDRRLYQNNGNGKTSTNTETDKNKNMIVIDRGTNSMAKPYDPSHSDGRKMQPVRMNGPSSADERMTSSSKNDEAGTPSRQQTISRTLFPDTEKKAPAPTTTKMNAAGDRDMKWPIVKSTLVLSSHSRGGRTTGPGRSGSCTKSRDESTVVALPPRSQPNSRPLSSSQGVSESQFAPRLLRKKSSIQSTASNGTTSSCASNDSVCVTPTPKELKFVEVNCNPFGELDTYMDTQLAKDHMRFLSERSGVSQSSTNYENNDDGDFLRRQMMIGRCDDMKKDVRLPLPRTKAIAPRTSSRMDESDMMVVDQEPLYSDQPYIQQDDRSNLLRDSNQMMEPSSSLTASAVNNHEDTLATTTENMHNQGPVFHRDVQLEQLNKIADSSDKFAPGYQEIDQLAVKQALGVINVPPFPERNFSFHKKKKGTTKDAQVTLRQSDNVNGRNHDGDRNVLSYRSSALTPIQEGRGKDDTTVEDLTPKREQSLLKTPPSYGTESSNENLSVEHRLQPKQRRSPNSRSQEIAYRAAMAAGLLPSGINSSFLSSRQSSTEYQEELNYKASVMDLGAMGNEGAGASTLRRNRSEGYFQMDPQPNQFLDRNNKKAPRRVSDFTER